MSKNSYSNMSKNSYSIFLIILLCMRNDFSMVGKNKKMFLVFVARTARTPKLYRNIIRIAFILLNYSLILMLCLINPRKMRFLFSSNAHGWGDYRPQVFFCSNQATYENFLR